MVARPDDLPMLPVEEIARRARKNENPLAMVSQLPKLLEEFPCKADRNTHLPNILFSDAVVLEGFTCEQVEHEGEVVYHLKRVAIQY